MKFTMYWSFGEKYPGALSCVLWREVVLILQLEGPLSEISPYPIDTTTQGLEHTVYRLEHRLGGV